MREQNAEGSTLWIRADATPAMGTGHVMRCLALAQAWRDQGGAVVFFTATENRRLITRLVQEGCEVVSVPRPHPDAADRELLLQRAAACPPVWLVLDGYHFDAGYAELLRQQGVRLLVIDDTAHRKRYAADVLLNQNFGAQGLTYAGDPQAVLLLGPTYALLRREILQQRPGERKQLPDYRRILITLGGSDPRGLTSRVIRAVGESNLRNSLIYVVIGPANPRVDDVHRQVEETEQRVVTRNLRFQVNEQADMAEIFATSDLAISAAGSTTWEILHYGIPAVLITAAANQRGIVENLSQAGYVERAPGDEDLDERGLAELIDRIIANPVRLREMAMRGRMLVDGGGCRRVLAVMKFLARKPRWIEIQALLREATVEDAIPLWHLANDPETRRQSFRSAVIPWETHVSWLRKKLLSTDTLVLVAEVGGILIGTVRLEKKGEFAEVSYAVSPPFRGKGIGSSLLEAAADTGAKRLGVHTLRGAVKTTNAASVRSFVKAHFRPVAQQQVHDAACIVFEKQVRQYDI